MKSALCWAFYRSAGLGGRQGNGERAWLVANFTLEPNQRKTGLSSSSVCTHRSSLFCAVMVVFGRCATVCLKVSGGGRGTGILGLPCKHGGELHHHTHGNLVLVVWKKIHVLRQEVGVGNDREKVL